MDHIKDVNWDETEVLVGSLKSEKQFNINLDKKFYYTPLDNVKKGVKIEYVALYQSIATFGESAGIKYYGKVKEKHVVKRRDIPVETTRDNGNEKYALFVVDEWQTLSDKIAVLGEGVYKPRYTNLFLLQNCSYTYELFNVKSNAQFLLAETLEKVFAFAEINQDTQKEFIFDISPDFSVSLRENKINVFSANGKIAFASPIQISEYKLFPVENFNEITRRLNIL